MIPIRYNGYAGTSLIVAGGVALAIGLTLSYGFHVRTDDALDWAMLTGLLAAGVTDVVQRGRNLVRLGEGARAIVHPDLGGHIWYVPMWIIGLAASAAIFFGKHPGFRPPESWR